MDQDVMSNGSSITNGSSKSADMHAVKERLSEQARVWGDKMSEQYQALRSKTNVGVEKVSQYVHNNSSQDMMNDLSQLVRRHPVQTALIGLGIGLLVSRAFGSRK